MRVLHVADLHLGVTRYGTATASGNSRIEDFIGTLNRAVEVAIEEDVDAVVLAGDTFDSRRPGPAELAAVAGATSRLSHLDLIVLPGNHDGTTTIGDPATHSLRWLGQMGHPRVHLLTEPGWHRVGKAHVFALPYPHKRSLDAQLADVPVDERAAIVGKKVEDAIRALAGGMSPAPGLDHPASIPRIFVGHVSILGAALGAETAMRFGWDAAIGAEVLDGFDAAMLGHIHQQQQVGPRAWYAGSPEYIDFTEADQPKGFLLWDISMDSTEVARIPSNARPMAEFHIRQTESGGLEAVGPTSWPGASRAHQGPIIRLILTCEYSRPDPAMLTRLVDRIRRESGASYIRSEVRLKLADQRSTVVLPEGMDVLSALHEWLASRGQPDEPTISVGREMLASL